jgi:hypothetical protein
MAIICSVSVVVVEIQQLVLYFLNLLCQKSDIFTSKLPTCGVFSKVQSAYRSNDYEVIRLSAMLVHMYAKKGEATCAIMVHTKVI